MKSGKKGVSVSIKQRSGLRFFCDSFVWRHNNKVGQWDAEMLIRNRDCSSPHAAV